MNERKLNVNRPTVTAEEVAGYRDFGALLKRYETASRFRYVKFGVAGFAAAAAVALIVFFSLAKFPTGEPMNTIAFIHPPMKGIEISFASYSVDAGSGAELTYESGSKIKIPQNAFLDQNGNVVTGSVDLRYREFHDAADFFLSGIPMSYDSGGIKYQFKSAGMMEIAASQKGEPLQVNPESKIEIEMVSAHNGTEYNLYFLDTVRKQWVNKGKDEVVQIAPGACVDSFGNVLNAGAIIGSESIADTATQPEFLKQFSSDVADAEEPKPIKPKKATLEGRKFNFDVDPIEYPELALYKGLYFEIGEENKNFDPAFYKITWEDAMLRENVAGVNYILTLTKGAESHRLIVYPVVDDENYDEAMKAYGEKFSEYQSALDAKKAEEKRKKEEHEARMKKMKEDQEQQLKKMQEEQAKRLKEWQIQQGEAWAEQQKQMEQRPSYWNIRRVFQVDGFGIWNSDSPFRYNKAVSLQASFADESGTPLHVDIAYHIDKSRNTLFAHYNQKFSAFTYDPNSENILFIVMPDQSLAIFSEEDFKSITANPGAKYTFRMKKTEQKFKTVDEVKEFLIRKPKAASHPLTS